MPPSRYQVESVDRGIAILRALAERGSISLEQAVDITGAAKSTAYRLLDTLAAAGLVERDARNGYRPGAEFVRWGLLLFGRLDLPSAAAQDMRELWLETKESVGLAVLSSRTIVLTEILESPSPFRMAELPGTVIPPHSSALGKAVLAHLPPQELAGILGPEPYLQITPESPLTLEALQPRLERVRQEGYALDVGESSVGVACVAAPLFRAGAIAGGISVAGPRVRMTDAALLRIAARTREVAESISRRLSPRQLVDEVAP